MNIGHCCKNQVINEKWALNGTSIFNRKKVVKFVITWSKNNRPYIGKVFIKIGFVYEKFVEYSELNETRVV